MNLLPLLLVAMGLASVYFSWRRRYHKPSNAGGPPRVKADSLPEELPPDALHHDNWRIRKAAVEQAGLTRDPSAIPDLLAAMSDSDPDVRETARAALIGFGAAAVPGLLGVLGTGSQDARMLAAGALGAIGDPSAVPGLVTALQKDVSAWVRGPAAAALGAIGGDLALGALIGARTDKDADVRRIVAAALRRIGTREALAALANHK